MEQNIGGEISRDQNEVNSIFPGAGLDAKSLGVNREDRMKQLIGLIGMAERAAKANIGAERARHENTAKKLKDEYAKLDTPLAN